MPPKRMYSHNGNTIHKIIWTIERCPLAVSRRKFLHHGVLAGVACAASPLLALNSRHLVDGDAGTDASRPHVSTSGPGSWQDHAAALDLLGRSAFAGAVGTNFKVYPSAGNTQPVWVTLQAVEDAPKPAAV